ncbi:cyclic nucleotide-binding domain protein [Nautilia profundicola AmH]|uniref:Cyclic nucleotide-binding domain protein n=1 Tax=Nautilia profundicola (strain ATCC BAA-1463 / DSM 18972 / AmH) TaxID=598659 RepID=B9L7S1_NAUPA|nr:cyclic nucleotide-binding domain-containing protein [Nautilia profundicola]ACM93777.1 cyclic nucleotide-binding domain protein [Nautilia profundicola AmH]
MKHSIFKALNDQEVEEILPYFEEKHIAKDTFIVKEGEYSDTAFLLVDGEVSVIKETIYKDDYIVTDIKAGGDEFFGEVNLIDRGLVTSTIKAKSDCEILQISHNDFINMMDEKPTIAVKLLWVIAYDISKHLRKADSDVITLFNAFVEVVEND